ncbi:MAG: acyl-[acyl-carrier-protein]--UDP-N-acetylglucosamine O-acyltransferase [Alphaproteobacteria bacterium CG_4_10_14_0_2_um_filter_63_37]|nr:MAG: acyl-[acyl-carrier-protein]--UDP-N-acetylglucosamine O-acyltransferase [Proteobacteria bacterium CG1_02_64_396]PJA23503.1 MAG: acyl-[acyl-carrier-protein]--UDP-N-acetylglucosamine O-acyltransferase [Alphaproteobacteria bacterium CG_4_10_14_0_2_um_filter_63_37]
MPTIHPTALVDPAARLGEGVEIGPYSIVGPQVEIGAGTWIGPHVVIQGATRVGCENRIYQFCSLGEAPQDLHDRGEATRLEIGDRNQIRESVTVHRGSKKGGGLTVVGSDCYIMINTHIAHDCTIGNHTIIANNVALGGHCRIGNWVTLGGATLVHQFCAVGDYAFTGAGSYIARDVPPHLMVTGNPSVPRGLNRVGLKRRGFSDAQIRRLTEVYKILYLRNYDLAEATRQIEALAEGHEEVTLFADFLKQSKRGIIR